MRLRTSISTLPSESPCQLALRNRQRDNARAESRPIIDTPMQSHIQRKPAYSKHQLSFSQTTPECTHVTASLSSTNDVDGFVNPSANTAKLNVACTTGNVILPAISSRKIVLASSKSASPAVPGFPA